MPDAVLLLALAGLPFVGAVAAGLLPTHARDTAAWFAGAVALACLGLVWAAYPTVSDGGVVRAAFPWMPNLGLEFSLRMDGLAWLFAGLVTGIGALVVVYARYYMSADDPVPRFFAFLLAFMGAMNGVVLSGNLVQVCFFWELTSLFSFLLIGYWHHAPSARDGARMALTVTAAGGLALFAGVLVLGHIAGGYDLDTVLAAGERVRGHPLYLPALLLVLLGALTKSAQFPFHFWLPHAMAAPTPVSAYLHSATLVKAGVFLLARLWPVLAGTEAWFWTVGSAGLVTLLLGAYVAIFQNDLKGLLAYSTISHLGLITLLLGLNSDLALVAAVFHVLNHAAFKASLVHGRRHHRPRDRHARHPAPVRPVPLHALHRHAGAGRGGGHGRRAAAERLPVQGDVLRRGADGGVGAGGAADSRHAGERLQRCLLAALHPRRLLRPRPGGFAAPAARAAVLDALSGRDPGAGLHHGGRPAGGHGRAVPRHRRALRAGRGDAVLQPRRLARIQHAAADEHGRAGGRGGALLRVAAAPAPRRRGTAGDPAAGRAADLRARDGVPVLAGCPFGGARARHAATAAAASAGGLRGGAGGGPGSVAARPRATGPRAPGIDPVLALLWAVGAACALGAAWQAKFHRLAALVLLGGVGLVVCVTFVWFSAPDLALTQLLVEIVTTVLLLLGLRWLPRPHQARESPAAMRRRLGDLGLAAAAGVGAAALAFAVMIRTPPDLLAATSWSAPTRRAGAPTW